MPEASSHRTAVTPFPYGQMVPLTFVLLNEMICMGMLFPIVGFLVAELRGVSVDESGYLSGILLGVFMLGQIASAKTWGYISDVYGRRFPLISGLFTSGLAVLFFGLSTNFWLCAVFRFCQGLFNGNILVAKTMIADVTDKTNQAKGFAVAGFTYGIGLIIGPAMGGLLYDPVHNLPSLHLDENSIFASRPALLPSMVVFIYSMVGMTLCTLFIKESNLKAKPLPWYVKYVYPCFWREAEFFVPPTPPPAATETSKEEPQHEETRPPSAAEEEIPADASGGTKGPESGNQQETAVEIDVTSVVVAEEEPAKFGYKQAFQHPETSFMLILYMVFAGGDTLINEVFPLWAIASVSSGGFAFSSDQIGLLLLANGIPCLLSTLVFSAMCDRYEDKAGFFRFNTIVYGVTIVVLPFSTYLPHGWLSVTVVVVCQFGRQLVANWCFALCTMFTARSAPEKFIGAAMGISQSSCAFTRALVPFIFTPLFAWSISGNHIFPFNHCLCFLVSAGCAFTCCFRMYMVSSTPEGRIVIQDGGAAAALTRMRTAVGL